MASLLAHVVVPVSIRMVLGKSSISGILLFCGCVASVLPDVDVIAFKFGIPYESPFGHRGATHSIMFALFVALLGIGLRRHLKSSKVTIFSVLFLATASHCVLDALTNGGLGVAFFWPFVNERYFLPWQPIQVSPISLSRFVSERGLTVLKSEILVVFVPALVLVATTLATKFLIKKKRDSLAKES